jgi:hypothetical protein
MTLGVAAIGAGSVSDLHRSAIEATAALELVGLFDVEAETRRRRSAAWRVRAHERLADLLEMTTSPGAACPPRIRRTPRRQSRV